MWVVINMKFYDRGTGKKKKVLYQLVKLTLYDITALRFMLAQSLCSGIRFDETHMMPFVTDNICTCTLNCRVCRLSVNMKST